MASSTSLYISLFSLSISFVTSAAVSVAVTEGNATSSCGFNSSYILCPDPLQSPFPFYFPAEASAETPDLFPMPPCSGITLEEATIDQLQDAMGKWELTAVALVECYVRRILQVDGYIR